jgi:hypothetical protein
MSGYPMRVLSVAAGEHPLFDRTFSGGILVLSSAIITADTLINTGPCVYYGYVVHVATATAAITIEDGLTAGAGGTKETIAISTAIGKYVFGQGMGIYCPTGIFANYAASATGSIAVLYLPQA